MSGRAATDRVIRGRAAVSVNDPGHPTPLGWSRVALTDVADLGTGHTPSRHKPEYWDGDIGWIGIRDAGAHHGGVIHETNQTITPLGVENSAARLLPKDTICLSRTASVGYVVKMGAPMTTSQDFVTWSCTEALEPDYLLQALLAEGNEIRRFGEGSTHTTIYFPAVKAFTIDLPPRAEQHRIVAKLDSLKARLARTRAELERVPLLVAKLRQTTLARAFAGDLSTDWRAREGSSMQDWRTCPLSDIADVQGGIQVGKKRPAGVTLVEVPYLRVANVQRGWLRLNEIKRLAVTAEERDRLLLKDGDILMNEGGDRDKLGRGWVWREEVPGCIHQNHVFRVRLRDPDFPPEFVSHYANEFGQAYFIDQGTQTTNLASISKRRVMALPVPVPPAAEAREIVRLITAAFARADRLEAEAARARALLDRLEAAILAKAFRGELVPQDPNDEPASVLLDRIRAERAAAPKPKRGRARKTVG
ncbi:restriction endonuclease subunit S [Sphingomonas sp. UBA4815]|uniref:restriction endonuclease subunit S n=1 Tax=Sphingomonas sp. UBA4815 TaxID=1947533 RepID=UPI0031F49E41